MFYNCITSLSVCYSFCCSDFAARSLISIQVSDAMATEVQGCSDLETTQTVSEGQGQQNRDQEVDDREVLIVPDQQVGEPQPIQTGENIVKDNEESDGYSDGDDDSFDDYMNDDSEDEIAIEARRKMKKKKPKKEDKVTVPMILHYINSDLDITLILRAVVCQAVCFHSNSAARGAITTGQLVDLGGKEYILLS